jgi:energy-coupling factor transporter ATP-binding protein EcfA2
MIVEFVGTPGSGKTTLATALLTLLEEHQVAATNVVDAARRHVRRTPVGAWLARGAPPSLRDPLLWQAFYVLGVAHAIGFALEHPRLVRHAVCSQLRPGLPFRTRIHVLYWFVHLCGRYRFLRATSSEREVLVLDDGFMQRAVHLFASPFDQPDPTQIQAYVDLIPRPDLLVLAVAEWSECERRVRERGVWRHARHLSDAQLSLYFERAEQVVEVATRRAHARGWSVTEIATEHPGPDGLHAPLVRVAASVARPNAGSGPVGDGGRVS